MVVIRQIIVCPECGLRVFSNSVKCGGCSCSFHAETEKCAKIDAANWPDRWLSPDFSSKNTSNLRMKSSNSHLLPCSRSPVLQIQVLGCLIILKELNVESLLPLLSQKQIPSTQYLRREETFPLWKSPVRLGKQYPFC